MGLSYCNRGGGSVGGVSLSFVFVGGSVVVKSVSCGMLVNLVLVWGGSVSSLLGGPSPMLRAFPSLVGGGLLSCVLMSAKISVA